MNEKLIQKINTEIKEKNLQPTSRWFFRVKNLSLWIPGILSIIIGALAVSSLIFGIDHGGVRYAPFLDTSFMVLALKTLPYIWIVLSFIFAWITVRTLRITRHGYRYKAATLVLASALISIVLGGLGYVAGIGRYIDTQLAVTAPHVSVIGQQQIIWNNPDTGRLAGTVRKVRDDFFTVKDVTGKMWLVTIDDVFEKETVIFNTLVSRGKEIRILGYRNSEVENAFHACFITPLIASRFDDVRRLPIPPHIMENMSDGCKNAL
jgi:hypothetical protein